MILILIENQPDNPHQEHDCFVRLELESSCLKYSSTALPRPVCPPIPPGIERIRFATSHPRYFTERLIHACAALPKLCEFFHIPFQSGNNDILREMK